MRCLPDFPLAPVPVLKRKTDLLCIIRQDGPYVRPMVTDTDILRFDGPSRESVRWAEEVGTPLAFLVSGAQLCDVGRVACYSIPHGSLRQPDYGTASCRSGTAATRVGVVQPAAPGLQFSNYAARGSSALTCPPLPSKTGRTHP